MTRTTRAAGVASAALLAVLLSAGPAAALGDGYGEAEVGIKGALVLYVLVPLAILVGMAALVWLPGVARNDRYRPARGWSAPPLWFAGPDEPDAAVAAAQPGDVVRGGASGSW